MSGKSRQFVAAVAAVVLSLSSTVAAAATAPAAANPWVALGAFSSSAASSAVSQSPVGEEARDSNGVPVLSLAVILATLATAAWIISQKDHHHGPPVSPD